MKSSCQHTEDVSAWLDGELSPEETETLELHLAVCAICQEEQETIEELSEMFAVFREPASPRDSVWTPEADGLAKVGFQKMLSLAALVVIGLGAIFSLTSNLQDEELRFERYLERSLDQDVLEMTALGDDDISRDRVVGLLISSSH
jgi:anti-sigma factor RsiW